MKRIVILFGVLALALGSQAQINQHRNYIGLNIGGGLDNLVYSPMNGQRHLGWGYLGELKYQHFFGKHWGFGLGVQYNMTHSNVLFDQARTLVFSGYQHPESMNNEFDIYNTYDNWHEYQHQSFINVPLEVYYRNAMNDRWTFLLGFGAQLDLPLNGNYTVNDGQFVREGYAPVTNVTYRDLPNHGFYTYAQDVDQEIDNIKMGVSAIADLGFNYALSNKWGLYLGIYGGYAINNMLKEASSEPLFSMHARALTAEKTPAVRVAPEAYNGVLNSNEISDLHLLNLGVKVGINFGWKEYIDPDKAKESELVNYYMDEANKAKAAEEAAKAKAAEEVAKAKAAEDAANAKAAQEAARAKAAEDACKDKAPAYSYDRDMMQRYVDLINTQINFGFSKTKPIYNDETDHAIKALSSAMAGNKDIKVIVTGHTDNIGSDESNMRLGQRRAEAVKNVMIGEGAPAESIATESKGEREPIVENDTDEHRYQNRRAVISLR